MSFLTCCAALALLLAALTTQHWIVGRAHRQTNSNLSDGRIQFGLFYGLKNLNVGYGWRSYEINGNSSCILYNSIQCKMLSLHTIHVLKLN